MYIGTYKCWTKDIISVPWSLGAKWLKTVYTDSYEWSAVLYDDPRKKLVVKNKKASADFVPILSWQPWQKPDIHSISKIIIQKKEIHSISKLLLANGKSSGCLGFAMVVKIKWGQNQHLSSYFSLPFFLGSSYNTADHSYESVYTVLSHLAPRDHGTEVISFVQHL